jgi:hypothetical protein
MRINRKNEKFYRTYALERWKDVHTNKKDALVFLIFKIEKCFDISVVEIDSQRRNENEAE